MPTALPTAGDGSASAAAADHKLPECPSTTIAVQPHRQSAAGTKLSKQRIVRWRGTGTGLACTRAPHWDLGPSPE
jgi:hypothetical protein